MPICKWGALKGSGLFRSYTCVPGDGGGFCRALIICIFIDSGGQYCKYMILWYRRDLNLWANSSANRVAQNSMAMARTSTVRFMMHSQKKPWNKNGNMNQVVQRQMFGYWLHWNGVIKAWFSSYLKKKKKKNYVLMSMYCDIMNPLWTDVLFNIESINRMFYLKTN